MGMNPAQQKHHTKRTDELEQALVDLGTVIYAKVDQVAHHAEGLVTQEHRLWSAALHAENEMRRNDVRNLDYEFTLFTHMPFWRRLRWVLTGATV